MLPRATRAAFCPIIAAAMRYPEFGSTRSLLAGRTRLDRRPARRRSPPRSTRASSPVRRTLFHAPSFSAGVVMGAVVVLGAAYLPELVGSETIEAAPVTGMPEAARPQLTFEFDDLLKNSSVVADPEPYRSEPDDPAAADEQILLQAASFRSREDAERLRAALLLMELPAATSDISLSTGHWYRVTVGPFDTEVKAQRALTRLREKDIAAIRLRRRTD